MMKSNYRWVVLFGLIALAMIAGIYRIGVNREAHTDKGLGAVQTGDRIGELEERQRLAQEEVNSRLSRIEQLLNGRKGNIAKSPESMMDMQALAKREADRALHEQGVYQRMFVSDPRGSDADKLESRISNAFSDSTVQQAPDQPSSHSVECHQRICALYAVFPAETDGQAWLTRMSIALGADFGSSRVVTRELPSGENEMTIYTFRKGSEFLLNKH